MMASQQVINISKLFKLIQPTSRKSWPWLVEPKRILVLFLPWMNSQEKNVAKYTSLYGDLGLDVLCMECGLMDFLWPPRSLNVARHLVKILQQQCKDYDFLFIHSMSVGAYHLTCFHMILDETESAKPLLNKVTGIIYDSVLMGAGKTGVLKNSENESGTEEYTDTLDLIIQGMSTAISDKRIVFHVMNFFAKTFFALTKSTTLDFYKKAFGVVRDKPFKVPTLMMASKNDPVSDYRVMMQVTDIWKNEHSVPIRIQLWDKSGHAQHLAFHKDEYMNVQQQFMSEIFGKSKL